MRLLDRVKRLEQGGGCSTRLCPVCGLPLGGLVLDDSTGYALVFGGAAGEDDTGCCSECGVQHTFVLTFESELEVVV